MSLLNILLTFIAFGQCFSASRFSQPLGISGRYLTTIIGIGSPPQYYELALTTENDAFFVLDYKTANSDVDYQYDFVKSMFVPEASKTIELGTEICRIRQLVSQTEKSAFGTYSSDYLSLGITTYGETLRFCMLSKNRTAITQTYDDPWSWLFEIPVDGFLGLSPGDENPIRKMRENTGDNMVTLWLDSESTEPDNAGTITFGSYNTDKCSTKTKSVLLQDYDHWRFFVNKVNYDNYEDKLNNGVARFDFTSDTLTVPQKTFAGLKNAYGGDIESFYCSYYNQAHNIVINTYGINLTIDVSIFVKPLESNSGYCELKIAQAAAEDEVQLIFGKQLLKQFCVTFDYDNYLIDFAELKPKE